MIHPLHIQRHGRGIIEGTQHTAHIFIRAVFAAPLMQRSRRFALEVDQVGIALDHQYLAQVQVTVDANAQPARRGFGQRLDMRRNGFFLRQ